MLLGLIFLLLIGGGTLSVDAHIVRKRWIWRDSGPNDTH
jgi:hypothetical protein